MPSMNISLTNELMELVQRKVASGMYNNASEVIRDAIRSLDKNEQLIYELKLQRLKDILAVGIAQAERGECTEYSYEELMADMDSELDAEARH